MKDFYIMITNQTPNTSSAPGLGDNLSDVSKTITSGSSVIDFTIKL